VSTLGRNPYVTVVAVWIVSSFGLALLVSFPIFPVILFFAGLLLVLVIANYLIHRSRRRDPSNQEFVKNLLSNSGRLAEKVAEDFGIISARVSAWWLQREARLQEEMTREHERKARRREKLTELKQKRRTRQFDGRSATREHEGTQRSPQEHRDEG
jgi:hypothetical protein